MDHKTLTIAGVNITACRRAIAAIHASIRNLAGGDPSDLLDNHCLGLLLLLGRQTGIDSVTTYGRKQHITVALDPHDSINDIHVRLSVLEEYLAKCVHFLDILEGKRREKIPKNPHLPTSKPIALFANFLPSPYRFEAGSF